MKLKEPKKKQRKRGNKIPLDKEIARVQNEYSKVN